MKLNTPSSQTKIVFFKLKSLGVPLISMDSNTSSFLLNSSTTFHSDFYHGKEDEVDDHGIIDLGLSLRTVQPETYHASSNFLSLWRYDDDLLDWSAQSNNLNNLKSSSTTIHSKSVAENFDEEIEGVQSNDRWAYVKVNMDGVTVGRKICVLDHEGYPSLSNQLENMFGSKSVSGLKLFQSESEYLLFYKDREDHWRTVGDVPWKEFVESVKRLRIARKNQAA